MNKKTQLLQNSLPIIGAGLGDKLGIKIQVTGNQASTDGQTITVPNFNITTQTDKDAVLGYMSHEAAHIKFDSFKGMSVQQLRDPLLKSMWNIFEDLRIEKAMIQSMIGTKKWMNQIWINRQKEGNRKEVTPESNPQSILFDYLLFTCRVKYREQTHLSNYLDAAEDAFIDKLGWKLHSKLEKLLREKLPTLNSSVDAFDLATVIHSVIEYHEPEKEDDESESGEGDESESGEGDESESGEGDESESGEGDESESGEGDESESGEGDESESGEGDESESGEGDESESGEGDESESGEGDESESGEGDESESGEGAPTVSAQQPSNEEIAQAIASLMNSSESDFEDEMKNFVSQMEQLASANTTSNEVPIPRSVEVDKYQTSFNSGKALTRIVKGTSNALSSKLQLIVEENQRVRCKTTNSGKKLNSKVLQRYSVGDGRLFKSKHVKKQIDTTVHIAVDNSHSMVNQDLLDTAKQAHLALCLALNKINGVSVSASAFPAVKHREDGSVINLLNESESINKLAPRMTAVDGQGSYTPSGSAMWHCLQQVLQSPKEKKVVLFITDGYASSYEQENSLISLVNKAEKQGIVVIGIAIGNIVHSPVMFSRYFQNALFISDISELKTKLFKVAQNILID